MYGWAAMCPSETPGVFSYLKEEEENEHGVEGGLLVGTLEVAE